MFYLNNSLDQFQDGWNHHGIHMAVLPDFYSGALELQQSRLHGLDFFLNVNENYGVEEFLKRQVTRGAW